MLRSPIKLAVWLGGLAVASLLSLPASAQFISKSAPATNVPPPDVRARLWAATARFVYGDDPALASLRPQLRQTIDSSSVKAFGRHLEDAVKLENKRLPKQEHVLKFQGDFKTISAKNELPAALATSIANRLRDNKPERQNQAAFVQLRQTLHALADPNAPVVATAPRPAGSLDTAAAAPAAVAATPAAGNFTTTPTPPSPMLTYLPLVLSILSLLVALVALMKSSGSKRRHHGSSAPASLATLTDEMRAEVRTLVQREVSNKMPGARPAPAPAAKPQASTPAAAPVAPVTPAPAPIAKVSPPQPMPAQMPAQPLAPVPAASPAPAESVASPVAETEDFFTVNYPVPEEAAATPAAPPTRTLYANQQPIDGIFQRNMLAEAPASYTIFELVMAVDTPDQARFVVTSNPAGHAGYIGSHVNILGGACEYPFPKGSVSRIVTDAPGVAQRTANGDWQISQKARIHFE